ncbi:MAG: SRPBCC domain-containing protein [Saprospiraceae bacterium]|nr:SRPBCC domain-containing protein [Saprospiraceae bacterium]
MTKSEGPIILKYPINASIDKLWSALVELEEMVQWYFDNIPDFKAEVGFQTQFLITNEGRSFTHVWEVTRVIPQAEIAYSWRYAEYPGQSILTLSLLPEGQQLKLKVMVDIVEDFPQDIPEFKRESCIGGWNYFIGERLTDYLSSST